MPSNWVQPFPKICVRSLLPGRTLRYPKTYGPGTTFEQLPIRLGLEDRLPRGESQGLLDGERLFCVSRYADANENNTYVLDECKIPGGERAHPQESVIVPCDTPQRGQLTSVAWSGSKLYAGTHFGLLEYAPGGEGRVVRDPEGILESEVYALAWLDGRLYLGLGTESAGKFGFASFDPVAGRAVLIASSVAVQKKTPLDGTRFEPRAVLSDPNRKCLWLDVAGSQEQCGLWRYWTENGKFEKAVPGTSSFLSAGNVAWCSENILWHHSSRELTLVAGDTLAATPLRVPHATSGALHAVMKSGKDSQIHSWPAWYEGERLFLGGASRALPIPAWLSAPGKESSPCVTLCNVTGFYPARNGLLAVTLEGTVFLIKRK